VNCIDSSRAGLMACGAKNLGEIPIERQPRTRRSHYGALGPHLPRFLSSIFLRFASCCRYLSRTAALLRTFGQCAVFLLGADWQLSCRGEFFYPFAIIMEAHGSAMMLSQPCSSLAGVQLGSSGIARKMQVRHTNSLERVPTLLTAFVRAEVNSFTGKN